MKNLPSGSLALIFAVALGVSACHNRESKQKPQPKDYSVVKAGSDAADMDTVCFLGTQGTDSTRVSLYINKGDVSGRMDWIPYEKDSRRGKLAGNKKDSLISAAWIYMQEGKPDSMKVQFKLMGDKLYQQPMQSDPKTGQLQADSHAPWSVVYQQVDCGKVH